MGVVFFMVMTVGMMVRMTGVQIITNGDNGHGGDFDSGNHVLIPIFCDGCDNHNCDNRNFIPFLTSRRAVLLW